MSASHAALSAYPYADRPLVPQWRRAATQLRLGAVAALAGLALGARGVPKLTEIDAVMLHVGLPAALAGILALAPTPPTRAGRRLKDIFVCAAAAACFAGDYALLMLALSPCLLALSPLLGRSDVKERAP